MLTPIRSPRVPSVQQVFSRVAKHLLKQNRKSGNGDDYCLYRGPEGTSCAVGCLIPDGEYFPEIENLTVGQIAASESRPARVQGISFEERMPQTLTLARKHQKLLKQLQLIHDGSHPENWKFSLESLASQLDLKMPPAPSGK